MKIVYLLKECGDLPKYKIGVTSRGVEKRIKQLQTGNSERIEVIQTFPSVFNRKIESSLHRKYETKRLEGEWFQLDNEDVDKFINECQKIHNVFEMLTKSGNPFI
tara:strand:- start:84 stop:398 length:315 start_codon:yes stop_codon:yes gene_type:complete